MKVDILNEALAGKWLTLRKVGDTEDQPTQIVRVVDVDDYDEPEITCVVAGFDGPGYTVETFNLDTRFFDDAAAAIAWAQENPDEFTTAAGEPELEDA